MKPTFFVLLTIVILPFIECSAISYLKEIPVVGTVVNKTSQAIHYISDKINNKGRSLKDTVTSYFGMGDKNLELELDMTPPQILAYHGYPAESHIVVTDDGYILTVHRMPYSKHSKSKKSPKKVVLLHHGVLGSSADWLISGPEKGLAYILSESGYDVWMANIRGNTYSKAHMSRQVDSYSFWNFTFHEVSQYDLPAVIDYIADVKGPDAKINYVGFSMGTTVLFALLSTKTQYNDVLNAAFAMAPIAYMSNVSGPIQLFAKYSNNIETLMKLVGANEFLPQNEILTQLSQYAFKLETKKHKGMVYKNIFFALCGYDEKQFNKSLVPAILSHVPAGTSTKNLVHYAQEINNCGNFQQFDYGLEGNLRQYGSETPSEYPVERITLPVALISANNDWLASSNDVNKLFNKLANPIGHFKVPYEDFNHIDFLWAVDAPTLVYQQLLQLLEEYNNCA